MTEALRLLIDNRDGLVAMRAKAREHVLDRFTIEREAHALIAIYREMLA